MLWKILNFESIIHDAIKHLYFGMQYFSCFDAYFGGFVGR